jgi:hypothetical protein
MFPTCRFRLAFALAIWLLQVGNAVAQAPAVQETASGPSSSSEVQAQRWPMKSVLGIEVRSSHSRNIGRIVDVLTDRGGIVRAAVIEFGGFLGIGTRKIAVDWSDLRFQREQEQLVATLDIPRDQLLAAPDYKTDQPTIVTKVTEPVLPSTHEPRSQSTAVAVAPSARKQKSRKGKRHHRLY